MNQLAIAAMMPAVLLAIALIPFFIGVLVVVYFDLDLTDLDDYYKNMWWIGVKSTTAFVFWFAVFLVIVKMFFWGVNNL